MQSQAVVQLLLVRALVVELRGGESNTTAICRVCRAWNNMELVFFMLLAQWHCSRLLNYDSLEAPLVFGGSKCCAFHQVPANC